METYVRLFLAAGNALIFAVTLVRSLIAQHHLNPTYQLPRVLIALFALAISVGQVTHLHTQISLSTYLFILATLIGFAYVREVLKHP